jgi:GxxExxY protein
MRGAARFKEVGEEKVAKSADCAISMTGFWPPITPITPIGDRWLVCYALRVKLTGQIIGAAMEVHRLLGPGFLESIYQRALVRELRFRRLCVQTEVQIAIPYKGASVGLHRLDLVVENSVVVELKAATALAEVHRAQVLSYLKATGLEVGLILNFGERSLIWKRVTHTSNRVDSAL